MKQTEPRGAWPTGEWERLAFRLRRPAYALTGDADRAGDLVQQTLLRLLTRAPEQASNLAYARTVMTRLWLDQERALRRRMTRLVTRSLTATRWHIDENAMEREEGVARVLAAIESLPARQRAVLVLRLIEDLDYPRIAEVLGCGIGNVRSLMHAARQRVRSEAGGLT